MSRSRILLGLSFPVLIFLAACQAPLETRDAGIVSDPVLLKNDGGRKYNPIWSPDGSRIYFQEESYIFYFRKYDVLTCMYDTLLIYPDEISRCFFAEDGKSALFQTKKIDMEYGGYDYMTYYINFEEGIVHSFPFTGELWWTTIWDGNIKRLYQIYYSEYACTFVTRNLDGEDTEFTLDPIRYPNNFSVSLDGNAIICEASSPDTSGIWLATADSVRLIAGNTDSIRYSIPAWSPSNQSFLYTSANRYSNGSKLIMASQDDLSPKLLTDDFLSISRIKWAHDGKKIFIQGRRQSSEDTGCWIYAFDQDTLEYFSEYVSSSGYSWFPEEQIILGVGNQSYYQFSYYEPGAQRYKKISDDIKLDHRYLYDVTTESDLIFADGKTLFRMTADQGITTPMLTAEDLNVPRIQDCSLSPTKTRLAFDDGDEIYIYNLNNHELKCVTENMTTSTYYPIWSPDGKYLAAFNYDSYSGYRYLGIINLENSNPVFESKMSGNNIYNLSWSPKFPSIGSYLIFTYREVMALNTQTWQPITIIDRENISGNYCQAVWSPDGSKIALILDYTELWSYGVYKDLRNQ